MAWIGADEEKMSKSFGALVFTAPDPDIPIWCMRTMVRTNGLVFPLNVQVSWYERFPKYIMPCMPRATQQIHRGNLEMPDLSTVGWGKRCVRIKLLSENPAICFVEPSGILHGRMSPFSNLTLGEERFDKANIPRDAVKFAFCYPWDIDWRSVRERALAAGFHAIDQDKLLSR